MRYVSLQLLFLATIRSISAGLLRPYTLHHTYNHINFFDEFRFIQSNFTTGNYNDVDPTSGYVNYRNQSDAERLGLIKTHGDEVFLGVNHVGIFDSQGKGRDSVRVESKKLYNHGLFIAEFTHMPEPACGVWPAFWTYGDPWPRYGEVDLYENWNLAENSMTTLHTANASQVGTCTISQDDMLNPVVATNCDVTYHDKNQGANQACNTEEKLGQWGSRAGGVYAMEWTSQGLRIWSWSRFLAPLDIRLGTPNPDLWGLPHFAAGGESCDMDKHVANQKLVLNIDFCGVTAGDSKFWNQQCRKATGYDTCIDYVANHPEAFSNVYWKVKSIDVYITDPSEHQANVSSPAHRHTHSRVGYKRRSI